MHQDWQAYRVLKEVQVQEVNRDCLVYLEQVVCQDRKVIQDATVHQANLDREDLLVREAKREIQEILGALVVLVRAAPQAYLVKKVKKVIRRRFQSCSAVLKVSLEQLAQLDNRVTEVCLVSTVKQVWPELLELKVTKVWLDHLAIQASKEYLGNPDWVDFQVRKETLACQASTDVLVFLE